MKFILATSVRNEGPYLLEWIAHYKQLGFDQIIIFSNDNDDGSDVLLAALKDEGLIDWRPRILEPDQRPQLSAFLELSKELFSDTEQHGNYLAWFDCDEFLVLKKHRTVRELLSYYAFPDALFVNWKHFGSSGIKHYSPDLTINRFLQCSSTTVFNKQFKSISKIDPLLFSCLQHHRPIPQNKEFQGRIVYATLNPEGQIPERTTIYGMLLKHIENAPIFHEVCHLNHYAIRSHEEYQWKIARGNGWQANDGKETHFKKGYFSFRDFKAEEDRFASEKYSGPIKNYIALLPMNLMVLEKKIVDAAIEHYGLSLQGNLPAKAEIKARGTHWLTAEGGRDQLRGYSIDEVEKRLAYGSFVGDALNYVFIETPKAACSTLKWVLVELERCEVRAKHWGRESVAAMAVHYRANHGIKSLMQIKDTERLQLLTGKTVRFCVVRNPYSRLVSAWAHKIRQKEPGCEHVWQQVAEYCGSNPLDCPTFQQFVRWIVETQRPNRCNPHWRAMVYLLLPELLNYTHTLHTENLVTELQVVLDQIAPGQNAGILLKKHSTNESLPMDWQTYYDEDIASQAALFYKEDFEQYGYSLDSWRSNISSASLTDEVELLRKKLQKYEQVALEAIRGRNEVIVELFKKNQSAVKKYRPSKK